MRSNYVWVGLGLVWGVCGCSRDKETVGVPGVSVACSQVPFSRGAQYLQDGSYVTVPISGLDLERGDTVAVSMRKYSGDGSGVWFGVGKCQDQAGVSCYVARAKDGAVVVYNQQNYFVDVEVSGVEKRCG